MPGIGMFGGGYTPGIGLIVNIGFGVHCAFAANENVKKALSVQKSYEKNRNDLIKSFSKQDQSKYNVTDPYVFRVNLGTYGQFDTPVDIYNEGDLISVPLDNATTTYIGGMFYNMNEAISYQKQMRKRGYSDCFVVAFKDGEKTEF